jgi:hypothetical protein
LTSESPEHTTERQTFILRLWREKSAQPGWRGQVTHVQSGQMIYVRSPQELLDYLQRQMAPLEDDVPTRNGLR